MKKIVEHKKHEFETSVGNGYDAAKNYCKIMLLQNPVVNVDTIIIDVYQMRQLPIAPAMSEHVRIEWDEIEMQREPNKERRQSKWRRRTRWINTQMS